MIRSAEETRFWRWLHKIIEIQKLHDFEHGLFVNVGVIQGGTVANAVAASCEVGIDIRYDSFERLEETLQAIKKIAETRTVPDTNGRCDLDEAEHGNAGIGEKSGTFPPCPEDGRHDRLRKAADKESWRLVRFLSGCGGRRSGSFGAMGVKGANNHSMEEYAVAETLFSRAKLALASIITF